MSETVSEIVGEQEWLAERFEANRAHLRAVAYRLLGSLSEADDAVQEAWLHLNRSDPKGIENLGGWLTRVVARVCLDMLRSRKSRREESLDAPDALGAHVTHVAGRIVSGEDEVDPEHEVLLADAVGLALLVVLEALAPAERLAFVLHDMFGVPFDEIAPIVGRSSTAARQLASRARRRVQGRTRGDGGNTPTEFDVDLNRQRAVVEAFLAASRNGDFEALIALLDPGVVTRADGSAPGARGVPRETRGARAVARQALTFSRQARFGQPALVNGAVGVILAPRGRLSLVLGLTVRDGKIVEIDVIADPERLRQLELAVLDR